MLMRKSNQYSTLVGPNPASRILFDQMSSWLVVHPYQSPLSDGTGAKVGAAKREFHGKKREDGTSACHKLMLLDQAR